MNIDPDRFILNHVYQPVADFVRDHCDKSCYWLAAQCSFPMAMIFLAWGYFEIKLTNHSPEESAIDAACLLLSIITAGYLYHFGSYWDNKNKGDSLNLRPPIDSESFVRVSSLIQAIMFTSIDAATKQSSFEFLFDIGLFIQATGFYFLAAIPHHPRRPRKAMSWVSDGI